MLLMIDNYDSFTYNVVQYFGELGVEVLTVRNDNISLKQVADYKPSYIVISPGPCTPNEAGISLALIKEFAGLIPILGICLGHQGIAQAFGGEIIRAKKVMHGKTSKIKHNNAGVFSGLANAFVATRYHSLVVNKENLPQELEITAWSETKSGKFEEIMGIKHRNLAVEGVQFHPESILTEHGHQLLNNFLEEYK